MIYEQVKELKEPTFSDILEVVERAGLKDDAAHDLALVLGSVLRHDNRGKKGNF